MRVDISYNPYRLKTSLKVNGKDIMQYERGYESVKGFISRELPLQFWLDPIPYQGWKGLVNELVGKNDERELIVQFSGREIDAKDVAQALENQTKAWPTNLLFQFSHEAKYRDETAMQQVDEAYKLVNSESFRRILDDKRFKQDEESPPRIAYRNLQPAYEAAKRREFRIVLTGPYSSGKSTLINAILGKDILPTSDRPKTGKAYFIHHDPKVEYARMKCLDENGRIVVEEKSYDRESLRKKFDELFPSITPEKNVEQNPLSNTPEIHEVHIGTDIGRLYKDATYTPQSMQIVLVDTPGTDSALGNKLAAGNSHADIAKAALSDQNRDMVIFVSQAKTGEQSAVIDALRMAAENRHRPEYDQRFLFVLNQADTASFENNEEQWEERLRGLLTTYQSKDFEDDEVQIQSPRFFPTNAKGALAIRMGDDEYYWSKVLPEYYTYTPVGMHENPMKEYYHFDQFCSTSEAIKAQLRNQTEKYAESGTPEAQKLEIELHTGIPSLEKAIVEYIGKYAVPLKVRALLDTYETIYKETKGIFSTALKALNEAETEKNKAGIKREEARERHSREEESKKHIDSVKQRITAMQEELNSFINSFREDFKGATNKPYSNLQTEIDRAKDEAKRGKTFKKVLQIVDKAKEEYKKSIDEYFEQRVKIVIVKLEQFNELKTSIKELQWNDIKITDTVGFRNIYLRNPNYEYFENYTSARVPWKKKSIFKLFGERIQTLFGQLDSYSDRLSQNCDAVMNEVEKEAERAGEKWKSILEKPIEEVGKYLEDLKSEIEKYQKNIIDLKERLDRAAETAQSAADSFNRIKEYKVTIMNIRKQLKFVEEDG